MGGQGQLTEHVNSFSKSTVARGESMTMPADGEGKSQGAATAGSLDGVGVGFLLGLGCAKTIAQLPGYDGSWRVGVIMRYAPRRRIGYSPPSGGSPVERVSAVRRRRTGQE